MKILSHKVSHKYALPIRYIWALCAKICYSLQNRNIRLDPCVMEAGDGERDDPNGFIHSFPFLSVPSLFSDRTIMKYESSSPLGDVTGRVFPCPLPQRNRSAAAGAVKKFLRRKPRWLRAVVSCCREGITLWLGLNLGKVEGKGRGAVQTWRHDGEAKK